MSEKIKVGIVGYGNLGKGAELAVQTQPDMDLVGVFSRRGQVETITPNLASYHVDELVKFKGKIDVLILCGGSASDLPEQTPELAQHFNTVDSFDTHANIPAYFDSVDQVSRQSGFTNIISVGWDPGLFSINRVMAEAVLPTGATHTFWGKGLSQGHSDAVRRVEGVKNGVQYTHPSEETMDRVRAGENPDLAAHEKHKRECFVVLEEGASKEKVEEAIKTMPNYFADYETEVHFITEEELEKNHSLMPHGGFVIHSGKTGKSQAHNQVIEYSLKLESNPEFTASVLVAYARAAYRLNKEGHQGAKTVYEIGPGYIHPKPPEALRKKYL